MYCSHLSLIQFRNYNQLELPLPLGPLIFYGDNGQGKTNLLEALALLATTKSYRAGSDRELISWAAPMPFAHIAAKVHRGAESITLEAIIAEQAQAGVLPTSTPLRPSTTAPAGLLPDEAPPLRKRIKVNGVPKRALDVLGQLTVVLFTPDDLELVAGAPALRRRYLDLTICQVNTRYCRTLQDYLKVLAQRNALLKQIRDGADSQGLAYWTNQLIKLAVPLIQERQAMLEQVNLVARDLHTRLSGSTVPLEVRYLPALGETHGLQPWSSEKLPATTLASHFTQQFAAVQRREIAQGTTVFGPHRDDLAFYLDGVNMANYGSRGQQRTIVLTLKLAEVEYIYRKSDETPILLLDDVLSELDQQRRTFLLGAIEHSSQVFITSTNLLPFSADFLKSAKLFAVREGTVIRER